MAGARYHDDEHVAHTDARGDDRYFRDEVPSPQKPSFDGGQRVFNPYRLVAVVPIDIVTARLTKNRTARTA